jgi:hypothetical protein
MRVGLRRIMTQYFIWYIAPKHEACKGEMLKKQGKNLGKTIIGASQIINFMINL